MKREKAMDQEECRLDECDLESMPTAYEIKRICNLTLRYLNEKTRQSGVMDDVTAMHGWIIRYLYENRERDIYQKTIEREFCITKSTVTNVLKLMEEKGYIQRENVDGDARLKKITLTEDGINAHNIISGIIRETDEEVEKAIGSEEERESFRRVLFRIDRMLSQGEL